MTSIEDPLYRRSDWPLMKGDLDTIYIAIQHAMMANRTVTEVQTPQSRVEVEVGSDWRLFGITWVATEFLPHDAFRLMYDQGASSDHRFTP